MNMNISLSDIFPPAAPDTPAPIPKVPTGIRGLDAILHGGLPRDRTALLSGGPGTGKTVLAMEFLWRCALNGEPGLFISFEEQVQDIRTNFLSLNMDTAPLEKENQLKILHFQVPHRVFRSGEFNIQGLLALIDGHLKSLGAAIIVLDAIDMLMRVFGHADRERQEMYVLNDWLRQHSLTSIITVKSIKAEKKSYSFMDFMADCVIFLDQRTTAQVSTRRLKVIKYRGSDFLSNEHPYVISPDGVVLMPVSAASLDYPENEKRISTGNTAFDRITGGGFLQGASILIAGPSGSGKTTLAATFASAAVSRKEKILYVSFEESQNVLISRIRNVGIDLQEDVDTGRLSFLTLLPETVGLEQHLLRIFNMLDVFGPDHLVVDAITACGRMGSDSAVFDFLLRLITFCRKKEITCVYTHQMEAIINVTQISALRLSSVIDMLVLLQYVDDGAKLSRRLLVVKSRGSAHSMNYHPFSITGRGIEIQFRDDKNGETRAQEV
jgi:circadian clock protein KaiC